MIAQTRVKNQITKMSPPLPRMCRELRGINFLNPQNNARTHFHEPPTGAEVTDLDLPSLYPLGVYSTVFSAIEQRIESLW